jgi:signal transduction histidine kinase
MASEIARAEDSQKKLVANVSHDFRSPLTSIKGYLEALLDGTIPPEKYEKYLNIVLNETDRLHLLNLAIKDDKRFKACDIEFKMPKPSYTIHTLLNLEEKYPNRKFCLIIGSDNLFSFEKALGYSCSLFE